MENLKRSFKLFNSPGFLCFLSRRLNKMRENLRKVKVKLVLDQKDRKIELKCLQLVITIPNKIKTRNFHNLELSKLQLKTWIDLTTNTTLKVDRRKLDRQLHLMCQM